MNAKALTLLAALTALTACVGKDPATTGATGGSGGSGTTGLTPDGSAVPGSQQDLANNVGDRVLFGYDQSNLSGDARGTLDRQASWMQRYPAVTVQLAGDTDERGTQEYNLALGQRRANAARDYLVAHGISAARINTISYGKERPVALGSDEQAYTQNRNAVTSVQ